MYKKHEYEDSRNRAEQHDTKMDSVSKPCLRLCCRLQWFARLYPCNTHVTERLHEDLGAHKLRIKYVYAQISATTARQVCTGYNLLEADDAQGIVFALVCNNVKL